MQARLIELEKQFNTRGILQGKDLTEWRALHNRLWGGRLASGGRGGTAVRDYFERPGPRLGRKEVAPWQAQGKRPKTIVYRAERVPKKIPAWKQAELDVQQAGFDHAMSSWLKQAGIAEQAISRSLSRGPVPAESLFGLGSLAELMLGVRKMPRYSYRSPWSLYHATEAGFRGINPGRVTQGMM